MTKKELKKFDLLIGFVNNICEIVSNPEEYLDPNCKDSSVYSIGYCLDDKNNPTIETIECEDDYESLKINLDEIYRLVKAYSRADFTKQWEELRGE